MKKNTIRILAIINAILQFIAFFILYLLVFTDLVSKSDMFSYLITDIIFIFITSMTSDFVLLLIIDCKNNGSATINADLMSKFVYHSISNILIFIFAIYIVIQFKSQIITLLVAPTKENLVVTIISSIIYLVVITLISTAELKFYFKKDQI
ncbi:MAG: hypothetical protein Q4D02_07590 [Clostridia bacterium]|nr:hypothetical protein [Clostridia bacterium]